MSQLLELSHPAHVTVWPKRVREYRICPRQYRNRLLSVPGHPDAAGPSPGMTVGAQLHTELDRQHAVLGAAASDGFAPSDGFVHPLPADPELASWVAAHARWCPVDAGARYLGGERTLVWEPPGQQLTVMGRVDAVWEHADGTIEVRDYKSGAAPLDPAVDEAAAMYGLLASACWPQRPVRVTYELLALAEPELRSVTVDAAACAQAWELVCAHAQAVRDDVAWQARPGGHCRWCPYQLVCPEAEPG